MELVCLTHSLTLWWCHSRTLMTGLHLFDFSVSLHHCLRRPCRWHCVSSLSEIPEGFCDLRNKSPEPSTSAFWAIHPLEFGLCDFRDGEDELTGPVYRGFSLSWREERWHFGTLVNNLQCLTRKCLCGPWNNNFQALSMTKGEKCSAEIRHKRTRQRRPRLG